MEVFLKFSQSLIHSQQELQFVLQTHHFQFHLKVYTQDPLKKYIIFSFTILASRCTYIVVLIINYGSTFNLIIDIIYIN